MTSKIQPGEIFVEVLIRSSGEIEVSRPMTVEKPDGFSMSGHEFVAFGTRFSDKHLYPDGAPAGGAAPLGLLPTSVFIYCREVDLDAAKRKAAELWTAVHSAGIFDANALVAKIGAAAKRLSEQLP